MDAALPLTTTKANTGGKPFDAELDLSELDDRSRPGPTWTGHGRELSRSHLVFVSRRMSHSGRVLLAAVHLIDDRPVPLLGRVVDCEYEADGLHRIVLELLPIPETDAIAKWIRARGRSSNAGL